MTDNFRIPGSPADQPFGSYFHTRLQPPPLDPGPTSFSSSHLRAHVEAHLPTAVSLADRMGNNRQHFQSADSAIDGLLSQLPPYPCLLTPATDTPLLLTTRSAWEHEGVPFEAYELGKGLQYMTLVTNPPNRGITWTQGGWEEDLTPPTVSDYRSRTATPDASKKRTKISLSDYKSAPKKSAEEIEKVREIKAVKQKEEAEHFRKKRVAELEKRVQDVEDKAENKKAMEEQERKDVVRRRQESAQNARARDKEREAIRQQEVDAMERKEAIQALLRQNKAKNSDAKSAANALSKGTNQKRQAPISTKNVPPPPTKSSQKTKTGSQAPPVPAKAKKLPPMLSPLPDELDDEDENRRDAELSDEGFISLPSLLSPYLPDEVEAALKLIPGYSPTNEAHRESVSRDSRTVEARHDRARQADAPGVARKTVKPKIKSIDRSAIESTPRKIIKLKYGRRNARTVERILKTKPSTSRSSAEAPKSLPRAPSVTQHEDKKRPRDIEDHPEPPSKRPKVPARDDAATSRSSVPPAGKSPSLPQQSSHRSMLGTPRKGDAMARVASSDGLPRTPLAASSTPRGLPPSSTPASVERVIPPRPSADLPRPADLETYRAEFPKYQQMGTLLKRRMDQVLKTKEANAPPLLLSEQKLGAVIGIESAAAYMLGFNSFDKMRKLERKFNAGENWEQLLALLPFIVTKCRIFPELNAAALLAVAVSREMLAGLHIERLAVESGAGGPDFVKFRDAVVRNGRERAAAWAAVGEVDAATVLGDVAFAPGASTAAAVAGIVAVLERFVTRDGLLWEKRIDV